MVVTILLLAAGCGARASVPAARAQLAASCAGEPVTCQAFVDAHLRDAKGAVARTEKLQAACKAGAGASDACWAYAYFLADGAGVPTHPSQARELFDRQCRAGHAPSCRGRAWMTFEGLGGKSDAQAAQADFRAACDAGDLRGCVDYAASFERLGRTLTPDDAVTRLDRACTAGEARACARLSHVLAFERGDDASVARAVPLARAACAAGVAAGCLTVGRLGVSRLDERQDFAQAVGFFKKACELGDGAACAASADQDATSGPRLQGLCESGDIDACAYWGVRLLAKKGGAALPVLRRSCERGKALACYALAIADHDGIGVPRDPIAMVAHYQRACDLGAPEGCYSLSNVYYVAEDDAKGDGVLDQACSRGVSESCYDLATVRQQDGDKRMLGAYERACTAGSGEACVRIGVLHDKGKDFAGALPFHRRACQLREAEACARVAAWADGKQVGDGELAAAAMRACRLGSTDGCASLAVLIGSGRGVAQDLGKAFALARETCTRASGKGCGYAAWFDFSRRVAAEAVTLAQRACELGEGRGCTLLAWMNVLGEGVAQDEAQALQLFRHACALGEGSACREEYWMLDGGIAGPIDQKRAHEAFERNCELTKTCSRPTSTSTSAPAPTKKPRERGVFARQTGACAAATWADVPAGTATMRWSSGTFLEASRASLSAFRMCVTEVTQCQYLACVKAHKCSAPDTARMDPGDAAMLPVTGVTYSQASAYCEWEGGRLPSEAEWIYAAQGSGQPQFPWGDELPACVQENQICALEMPQVGSVDFDVSPFGVRDLGGTVQEWNGDWFGRWPADAGQDPRGPATGHTRVVRVGERIRPVYALIARGRERPDFAGDRLGFRCVKPAGTP